MLYLSKIKDFFNINDKDKQNRLKHILIIFIVIVLLYLLYDFFFKDKNISSNALIGGSADNYPRNVLLDKADFILDEISQSFQ